MRILLILILSWQVTIIQAANLENLRFWQQDPDTTRIMLDLSDAINYNIFTLTDPYRLVLDLKNTNLTGNIAPISPQHSILSNIRHANRNQQDLRIVFDLKLPIRTTSYLVAPDNQGGYRLLLDMKQLQPGVPRHTVIIPQTEQKPPEPKKTITQKNQIVVVIDPGHGGIDPGAVGKKNTKEKDVVLAISTKLANLFAQYPEYKAVLTRKGDYYLNLRRRVEIAREYQADLFISIHADALPDNQTAYGSSVYILSRQGASSEAAQWLAQRENAADLIGGISLKDKDDLLASVLLDLSQEGTLEASTLLAQEVLQALTKVGKVHFKQVQRAAFMVLRAPDIPSILVETAFISTHSEESKLNDPNYQAQVAQALLQGIKNYFAKYSPLARQ
jgi:N-acetylmuramoyl-L-alanine amidase